MEENLVWKLISYIFQLYETYEIKFPAKNSSFTKATNNICYGNLSFTVVRSWTQGNSWSVTRWRNCIALRFWILGWRVQSLSWSAMRKMRILSEYQWCGPKYTQISEQTFWVLLRFCLFLFCHFSLFSFFFFFFFSFFLSFLISLLFLSNLSGSSRRCLCIFLSLSPFFNYR